MLGATSIQEKGAAMGKALDGTVALVTGASSGIGAATARRLAREGAAVALVARRGDRLAEVARAIEAEGGTASAVVADITGRAGATDAVERAVAAFGRLDTVVNNAGAMLVGPFADAPDGEWERMVDINVLGLLYVTKAALPHLVEAAGQEPRRTADVVNISSSAGRVARPGTAVYNLTKFGVNGFTEALRQELQPLRVRVSVVEPGNVDTELVSHIREELRAGVEAQTGAIERLRPEDIADAVAYVVTSARRVAVNEVFVRAADQSW
ncbi:SDR family NAD(P)-dependent oxidoreductase [Streptomyces sp. NPDC047002]|uniref:SDR family NAD(P)-dependent oxidoreductase n=1 Tax=Streptomyces sp. NPDC047002 TaxID=3155475 RepID=UPI0034529EE9